jgi:hypothetical protein
MAALSDEANFATMLALSGMQVPQDQLSSLLEGYQHMMRQIDLLGRPTTLQAEPALIFAPEHQ